MIRGEEGWQARMGGEVEPRRPGQYSFHVISSPAPTKNPRSPALLPSSMHPIPLPPSSLLTLLIL